MRTKSFVAAASALLASLFAVQASADLSDGLVAYYPFDGTAQDSSGNGNHATPAGAFQFIGNGRTAGALRIEGDRALFYSGGGHVLLPQFGAELNQGFTLSFWTRDEAIGGNPVGAQDYISFGALNLPLTGISMNNNSSTPYVTFYVDPTGGPDHPGAVFFNKSIGNLTTFAASWKHFVLVYEPGTAKAYLNGEQVGEGSVNFTGFPFAQAALGRHWWDGGASSSARMSVTYDDVRIYSRAVTDAEVAELYSGTDPCAERVAELEAQIAELAAENLSLSAVNQALSEQITALQSEIATLTSQLASAQQDNTALTAQITELNAALDEIQRLLKLPPGKRSSTYRATGPAASKINAIIDALVSPPGKSIRTKDAIAAQSFDKSRAESSVRGNGPFTTLG